MSLEWLGWGRKSSFFESFYSKSIQRKFSLSSSLKLTFFLLASTWMFLEFAWVGSSSLKAILSVFTG